MKKLYEKFLKITENEKITEQKFNIRILTSVFTIFLSIVMLCSTTLAFFTNNATAGIESIKSAEYGTIIVATVNDTDAVTLTEYDYTCESTARYKFAIRAEGTASTGYLKINITVGDQSAGEYIKVLTPGQEFTFTLAAESGTKITFNPIWGATDKATVTEDTLTIELTTLPSVLIEEEIATPQYIMHTVAEGETLESIAEYYGLTVEEICKYNDIPANTILVAGSEIAIPVVPDDTTGEETEDTEETEPQFDIHIVAENETLETIAALYSMTVEELCEYNAITADTALTIGQEIKIPVKEQGGETEDELLPEELPEPSPSPSASPAPERTEEPDAEPSPRPSAEPSPEVSTAPSPEISTEPSAEPERTEEPAVTPEVSPLPTEESADAPEQEDIPDTLPVLSPETSPESGETPVPAVSPKVTSDSEQDTDAQPVETPDGTPEITPELTEVISSDEAASPDVTPSADASPAALNELQGENSEA